MPVPTSTEKPAQPANPTAPSEAVITVTVQLPGGKGGKQS